jgi:hypothetical protein
MVSPPSNDPFLGRKLGGRVELRARVGAGGMGAVYKGWHLTLNQQVAVKLLTPSPGFPLLAKRLAAEIAAARRISHPNVVKVIESGADALDGTPYVVMEYVEGRDLERLLARVHSMGSAALARDHPDAKAVYYEVALHDKRKVNDFLAAVRSFRAAQAVRGAFHDADGAPLPGCASASSSGACAESLPGRAVVASDTVTRAERSSPFWPATTT